nr:MAG TPA: hypothetical protein [Caudoviricetes sp.]
MVHGLFFFYPFCYHLPVSFAITKYHTNVALSITFIKNIIVCNNFSYF